MPDAVLRCAGRSWTAAQLAEDIAAASAAMPGPGHRILLLLSDPAAVLVRLLAAERVGAAVAVGNPAWPPQARATAAAAISARLVISDDAITELPAPDSDSSDIGWITFTSGSTGTPRAVARTRRSWAASFPAFTSMTELGAGDVVLVPGPLHSSLFCFAAVHALAAGAAVRLLPHPTIDASRAALEEADVVHLVPTMLRSLLSMSPPASPPRLVVCAGAKLDSLVDARAHAEWGAEVLEYYGSSEQSFVAARRGGDPATVGAAFPGVELTIRNGEIWSRSDFGCSGYLGGGGNGGALRRDGDWLTVGDRGELADGLLTVHGRGDAAIVTAGATVLAEDVEAVLRDMPGVRDAVVGGVPDSRLGALVVALLQLSDGASVDRRAVREFAAARLDPAALPRRWYVVPQLPRTASGKPARAAIAAGLQAGTLGAVPLR